MIPTSKPAVTPEMVEKARRLELIRSQWHYQQTIQFEDVSFLLGCIDEAASAVQDAVRECILICEAVADNLATFHSTMPTGARQCAAALREKYGVKP